VAMLAWGAGMCGAGVGGYRLILGGRGEGTSALRSLVRIVVAVFSIVFVLFASLALLGVARDLRRARQPVDEPTSTSTVPVPVPEPFEVR
jgi:HAMP domain-containing protein